MLEPIIKPITIAHGVARGVWNAAKRLRRLTRRAPYGSAAWAHPGSLNTASNGFALGRLPRWHLWQQTVFSDPESCIIMVGQRGAGKSLTMGASLHHARGDTLIVFDPPSQPMERHADALRQRGYSLVHIDLDNPLSGVAFDPMALLKGSTRYTFERDVNTIARLVVGEVEGNEESAGQHFAEMSVYLIAGVIAHLWNHDRDGCTLAEVANILSVGGARRRRSAFERMAAEASNSLTRAAVNAFEEAGDRERGSFATTLMRKLKPWTQATSVDLCRRDANWTWEAIFTHTAPSAVFITGGVGAREATSPPTRMIVGQAAATLSRLYNETRKPLARPVKLLLDEKDNLGACSPLINIVTELRKQRVTAFLCVQSAGTTQAQLPGAVSNPPPELRSHRLRWHEEPQRVPGNLPAYRHAHGAPRPSPYKRHGHGLRLCSSSYPGLPQPRSGLNVARRHIGIPVCVERHPRAQAVGGLSHGRSPAKGFPHLPRVPLVQTGKPLPCDRLLRAVGSIGPRQVAMDAA